MAIIGAGPAGLTAANLLAQEGYQIDVFEKRDHLGGNCFDKINKDGILIHPYGPHYFRTNSRALLDWLSNYTDWRFANYQVQAFVDNQFVPIPISLATMIQLTGKIYDKIEKKLLK